jgi:hypothetical protein
MDGNVQLTNCNIHSNEAEVHVNTCPQVRAGFQT